MRVYNFAAGPSTLPLEVLEQCQKEMLDYNGTGMSVVEMSHRSKPFQAVNDEAQSLLRELMNIPENYYVLFVQGGASQQFAAVPLNLMKNKKADYIVTGNFAGKAQKEAAIYGDAAIAASSKDKNFTYIPDVDKIAFREGIDYVHITSNNTIFGTKYTKFPEVDCLVADMSSNILSEPVDVSKFGVIYAGAQKNMAPAGMTLVIVREDLLEYAEEKMPTMLEWKTMAENGSMYNTPPCYTIYVAKLVYDWILSLGGLDVMKKMNEKKATLLYDYLDSQDYYIAPVKIGSRSMMNVTFVTGDAELDKKFASEAAAAGLKNLTGHRSVGGMRASIYNAMPYEGVEALVAFMKKFAAENPKA